MPKEIDPKNEEEILEIARERYQRCVEAETKNHERAKEAIEFRDGEQWPDQVKNARTSDPEGARPCLTLDKTNQYVRQVTNDQRQNKPAVKVRPVDDQSDVEVAEVFQGIIRHIEDQSSADVSYDTAFEHAVDGGFGYWRIITDYCDEMSFDQEIFIKRIRNRFTVHLDPNRTEPDGSDSQYGFIDELVPHDEFELEWPDAEKVNWDTDGKSGQYENWINQDTVRVAEYFCFKNRKDTLLFLEDGTTVLKSIYELTPDDQSFDDSLWMLTEDGENMVKKAVLKERATTLKVLMWYKINGKEILDSRELPGKWIPIIEVIGNELDVEGESRKSGLVRPAMDGQRMYNYSASSFVEMVALAPRAPYVAADGQVEEYEDEWRSANRRNLSVLRYSPIEVEGHLVPPPMRQQLPGIPAGWAQALGNFEHDIQGAMGMYNSSVGAPSNEKSGKAILARQRETDTGTFHYTDNLSRSIRHCGRILVDLIPKIYDTERIARILGEDGTPDNVVLDPEQEQPVREIRTNDNIIKKIYNLNIGKYDVTVSVGPSFTTKRQEAAEQMVQVVQAYPKLLDIIGDKMFSNLDWPGADEIADRLKKLLPPELQETDEEGNPNGQLNEQAMQIIAELKAALEEEKQGKSAKELELKEREVAVKEFDAATKRMDKQGGGDTEAMQLLTEVVTDLSNKVEKILDMPV